MDNDKPGSSELHQWLYGWVTDSRLTDCGFKYLPWLPCKPKSTQPSIPTESVNKQVACIFLPNTLKRISCCLNVCKTVTAPFLNFSRLEVLASEGLTTGLAMPLRYLRDFSDYRQGWSPHGMWNFLHSVLWHCWLGDRNGMQLRQHNDVSNSPLTKFSNISFLSPWSRPQSLLTVTKIHADGS